LQSAGPFPSLRPLLAHALVGCASTEAMDRLPVAHGCCFCRAHHQARIPRVAMPLTLIHLACKAAACKLYHASSDCCGTRASDRCSLILRLVSQGLQRQPCAHRAANLGNVAFLDMPSWRGCSLSRRQGEHIARAAIFVSFRAAPDGQADSVHPVDHNSWCHNRVQH
jgi:hypothetical protein